MPATNQNVPAHTSGAFKDPVRKQDLLDKMMSHDFTGDIRDLAYNRDLRMERVKPNVIKLTFGTSGRSFELNVRKPRGPRPITVKANAGKRINRPAPMEVTNQPETQNHEEPANQNEERQAPRRKRAVGESRSNH